MKNLKNDDAALAASAAAGDEKAFEEIVARHKRAVFGAAAGITGSAADAEEVAQEVFLKVYFSLASFRGDSALATWIYRIAVNTALDAARKNKKRRSTGLTGVTEIENAAAPSGPRAEEFSLADEVKKDLDALDEKYRAPLVLREYEGLRYEKIAEVLGISQGQVKIRIFRAREFLRKKFEEGGGFVKK